MANAAEFAYEFCVELIEVLDVTAFRLVGVAVTDLYEISGRAKCEKFPLHLRRSLRQPTGACARPQSLRFGLHPVLGVQLHAVV